MTDRVDGYIESIEDCLRLVGPDSELESLKPLLRRAAESDEEYLSRFHSGRPISSKFGIWFRGHADLRWELTPTVFRHETVAAGGEMKRQYYEEVSLFHIFKARVANLVSHDLSYFDWLCVMRHHALPTRLLDWSESVLVGLFFAIDDPLFDDRDSCLYVLNAYRLNESTGMFGQRSGLATARTSDVILRSCMALFPTFQDVFTHAFNQEIEDFSITRRDVSNPESRRKLCSPVAVIPNYIHNRLTVQSSVFTLHGGKRFFSRTDAQEINAASDLLDEPVSLETISAEHEDGVLLRFVIPAIKRASMRRHLERLGIHRGALFPDLENQALYLAQFWRHVS
jgi:hypothetical protein